MSPDRARAAATALAEAEREASPIAPLTDAWPQLDAALAYEIQLLNVGKRTGRGAAVRGHKVGLTSAAMQSQLGVDEPDYGHLLDDMFVPDGGSIAVSKLCAPRVEPEVAFVLGSPLHGPQVTASDVLAATDHLLPALEVIDSRIADWRIKLADTIADNASCARVVLGATPTLPSEIDLKAVAVGLHRNGEMAANGTSEAVLGNPANAVAWVARKLADLGTGLEAGQVIMPGSCTTAIAVEAGDEIRGEFGPLGSVDVRFAEAPDTP